jgi:serine/threonine protein kinase
MQPEKNALRMKNENAATKSAGGRFYYQAGDRPLEGVTIRRALGRGGFGEVYEAVTDAGKQLAIKHVLRAVEVERRGAEHCINIRHPNLVEIYDIRTNHEGISFVLMELVSGRSLREIIDTHSSGLPTEQVRILTNGILKGVAELHRNGVVHRDLKPANIYFDGNQVKVGDYGLSKAISEAGLDHSASVGTCYYMAPEIRSGRYDKPIDTYAIGAILFEMITGQTPFQGETASEILMRHQFDLPRLDLLPAEFRPLMSELLDKDSSRRPGDLDEVAAWINRPDLNANREWRSATNATESSAEKQTIHKLLRNKKRRGRSEFRQRVVIQSPPWPDDLTRQRGLCSSAIMAIIASWLIAGPVGFFAGVNMSEAPNRIAFLGVAPSIISIAMLWLNFKWELQDLTTRQKRVSGMLHGLIIGLVLSVMAVWLGVEQRPQDVAQSFPGLIDSAQIAIRDGIGLFYAILIGLSMGLPRWWRLAERDRRTRWSLGGIFVWWLWSITLGPLLKVLQVDVHTGISIALILVPGLVLALVSPWDKGLSRFRRLAG